MNKEILKKYDIEFVVMTDSEGDKFLNVRQIVPTDINYHLSCYFENVYVEFFTDDILPEINKALNGQPFNNDGGGITSFLEIGPLNSLFSRISNVNTSDSIPTIDMKLIIEAWLQWVTEKRLEKYLP